MGYCIKEVNCMGEKLKLLKAQMLQACTTIYDEEGMTALELAGRTACKVNEVVKLVNMLVDSIEDIVTDHIGDLVASNTMRIENETIVIDSIGGEE